MCAYYAFQTEYIWTIVAGNFYSLILEESDPAGGRNCPSVEASPTAKNNEGKTQLDEGCKTGNSKVQVNI